MSQFDLIVIGGGPGGYVAAIRAAQLGLRVACVDENPSFGGTCLRVGCIPSKALLESSEKYLEATSHLKQHGIDVGEVNLDLPRMMKRKDAVVKALTGGVSALLKKNKITTFNTRARLEGKGAVSLASGETLSAQHIIVATGTRSADIAGVKVDGTKIVTSTEALEFKSVPKHLVVIGAGYIGLEMGSVWSRLGSKVSVLEYLDRILPGMDLEIATEAQKIFKKQGLDFHLERRVTAARKKGRGCVVESDGHDPIACDAVLLAVGRVPVSADLGLEALGVKTDKRGFIQVDENFATAEAGIFAIGDVIGGPQLAHKAEEEGIACVEQIVTGYGHVNYDAIPGVVYTHPEIATVGKTQEQLDQAAVHYNVGKFPFRGNGRARAIGSMDGFVKILSDKTTDRILGVHIIGPHAGNLIAEAVAAMEFGASAEDLARTSHAHPTLPEAIKEAALATAGRALHI